MLGVAYRLREHLSRVLEIACGNIVDTGGYVVYVIHSGVYFPSDFMDIL